MVGPKGGHRTVALSLNTPLSMKYQKNDVYLSCYHVQMICVYFADLDVINHDEDMEEIG